jgi:Glycosyltransferases involved in cell wall biogenesis
MAITVIILTFNEEKHIERAIRSVQSFATRVFVIDCHSTDRTVEVARSLGAAVLVHPWDDNYARQFNWGLDNAFIDSDWIMRLDADEYVMPELADEIRNRLPLLDPDVSGIHIRRRVHFLGRWIRWGGVYPMWVLRLWRRGEGRCETRWMDEHIRVSSGRTIRFNSDIVDANLNDLTWWIEKHNKYATREAVDMLNMKYGITQYDAGAQGLFSQPKLRRWLKEKLYRRTPLFLRSAAYFFYRYVFRLGFLDGIPGLIWHVHQGLWYRFLVDSKIYEIEAWRKRDNRDIKDLIEQKLGLKLQ